QENLSVAPPYRTQPAQENLPVAPARPHAGRPVVVEGISIGGENPFQLQVRTTAGVTPQAQVITGPERLVIDVPEASPGRALRNQTVNLGQVERIRVGLLSAVPRVTRIVLDLNSPPSYNIQTSSSGFTVTLGANTPPAKAAIDDGQTIGWVSAMGAATNVAATRNPVVLAKPVLPPRNPSEVRVAGGKGALEIHARNATLSEVLFQVEKQTGAEIAIPAGTEQQRVIGDFGPGTASEVLAELLNGSDLNFVVVGAPNDPYALRSVILTRKAPGSVEPAPSNNAPGAANNTPPYYSQSQPVPEDLSQQVNQTYGNYNYTRFQPPPQVPQQPQDNAGGPTSEPQYNVPPQYNAPQYNNAPPDQPQYSPPPTDQVQVPQPQYNPPPTNEEGPQVN
ncbi:MAG: AMIN domain-containing protein, partial [Acidobacteria bacterium]|nr:AMIN domain-containing protein [Acidobacteriota bacterium]